MGGAMSSGESFSVSGLRTAGIKGREAVIWLDLERRGAESQRSGAAREAAERPAAPVPLLAETLTERGAMEIEAERTVVLIIDYQHEWVDLVQNEKGLLDRVARVQDAARAAGVPVIHIRTALGESPAGVADDRYQRQLRAKGWGKEGSKGAEIHPKVAPQGGEIVITKRHEGPFVGTGLERILRDLDRYYLVIAGTPTGRAVRNIGDDACNKHFLVALLSDCCADPDPEVHEALMIALRHQNLIVPSDEFLTALAPPPEAGKSS